MGTGCGRRRRSQGLVDPSLVGDRLSDPQTTMQMSRPIRWLPKVCPHHVASDSRLPVPARRQHPCPSPAVPTCCHSVFPVTSLPSPGKSPAIPILVTADVPTVALLRRFDCCVSKQKTTSAVFIRCFRRRLRPNSVDVGWRVHGTGERVRPGSGSQRGARLRGSGDQWGSGGTCRTHSPEKCRHAPRQNRPPLTPFPRLTSHYSRSVREHSGLSGMDSWLRVGMICSYVYPIRRPNRQPRQVFRPAARTAIFDNDVSRKVAVWKPGDNHQHLRDIGLPGLSLTS
ncbi:hypothetical protein Bbelb_218330 [Branchiostoma belcheri]|nr:hypothetical protein Bbelb_218330 [Branchiostoma belcheri]